MQSAPRRASLLVSLMLLGLVAPEDATPTPRIVNGVETQTRPTTGALLVPSGSGFSQICTGTLIGCETFLTAAHCVCPGDTFCVPTPGDYAVFLQHAGILSVSSVDVAADYDFGVEQDVAVIRLTIPTTGIPPTAINTTLSPPPGTAGVIAGFGITGNGSESGLLREGMVLTSSCGGQAPEPAHVCWAFEDPIGPIGIDSNTCSGDSGGPLFADVGAGEVVIGITSGGSANDCLPTDLSFDTNVFENVTFIQSIGGADLLNTTCGSISQVGDLDTVVTAIAPSVPDKDEQKCRKEVVKQYSTYVKKTLKIEQKCRDNVNADKLGGPCPDAKSLEKLAKAAGKVDPLKIAKKCTATTIPGSLLGGACAAAANENDLAACILAAGGGAVATMIDVQYADANPAGPLADPDEANCQEAIAKTTGKYAITRLESLTKCQANQDKGKVSSCPDTKTTDRITKAIGKVLPGIEKKCDNIMVASLDAAGTFGGSCGGSMTTAALATCQITDHDAEVDTLLELLDDSGSAASTFTVPAGTDTLRVTLDAIENSPNDVDLYIRLGAPPTTSVFDFSSATTGVFEAIEVATPTDGTWHVLVDEAGGTQVPYQLTITTFQP